MSPHFSYGHLMSRLNDANMLKTNKEKSGSSALVFNHFVVHLSLVTVSGQMKLKVHIDTKMLFI